MRATTLCDCIGVALALAACHGSSGLTGRTDADVEVDTDDARWDVILEDGSSWECTVDEDCYDDDPCTADSCDLATHGCIHEEIHGPALAGQGVQITDDPHYSGFPLMTWTGSEIGIAWSDGRDDGCFGDFEPSFCAIEIYFKRVTADGVQLSPDARISDSVSWSRTDSLEWTGSEFGLSWDEQTRDARRISLTRVSAGGTEIGPEMQPTGGDEDSDFPYLAWTGSEYALLWRKSPDIIFRPGNIMFSRFGSDGSELATTVLFPIESGLAVCSPLTWTGSDLVTSCYRTEQPLLRLTPLGEILGSTDPSDGIWTNWPFLIWNGSSIGVFWHGHTGDDDPCAEPGSHCSNVFYAEIRSDGTRAGEIVRVTDSDVRNYPASAVWTGSEYGLTWDEDDGWERTGYFNRITPGGSVLHEPARFPSWTVLVWAGSRYVAAWAEVRDGAENLFLSPVTFCE
jgi:hypothetical protein